MRKRVYKRKTQSGKYDMSFGKLSLDVRFPN